jgi:peptidoglycan hydrolase CwlO-like protein
MILIILLIIFFCYILLHNLLHNLFPVIKEGVTNKCKNDKDCAKTSLYEVEQNAPVIEKKIEDTSLHLDKQLSEVNNKIKSLAKKQKTTTNLIQKNNSSIQQIDEEIEE